MPFGLCNAPATFERLMETVLTGLNWKICLIYLDDIIVIGKTFEEVTKNLDQVLHKLYQAGLKLKSRKCQLFSREVEFLGHVISREGIKTDPKKTEAVKHGQSLQTFILYDHSWDSAAIIGDSYQTLQPLPSLNIALLERVKHLFGQMSAVNPLKV